jgi:hypothetical protein
MDLGLLNYRFSSAWNEGSKGSSEVKEKGGNL